MITVLPTSAFRLFMTRKLNTWFSVQDGNWNDPNTWTSNGLDKKNHTFPQPGDNVYINHSVTCNVSATVNNIYISGKLIIDSVSRVLTVNGDLQATGTVDQSAGNSNIILNGYVNYIVTFLSASTSTITYNAQYGQSVMPLTYNNLIIQGGGIKLATANLTVNTSMSTVAGAALELGTFDATFAGTQNFGTLSKTGSGTVNFNGVTSLGATNKITFTGNPTVNLTGSAIGNGWTNSVQFGTGTYNILGNYDYQGTAPGNQPGQMGIGTILIASGKTLTIGGPGGMVMTGTINGVDGTSTLNVNTTFSYGNTNTVMATGVFNYNFSGTSNIRVETGLTVTLPMTSFYDVTILGTGVLSGNTTISHNLTFSPGTLQLVSYDFTCSGTISGTFGSLITKTGSGTVNFNILSGVLNFNLTGNPTVNISGNCLFSVGTGGGNFGSNPINITASITFGVVAGGNVPVVINSGFLIAAGVTMQNVGVGSTLGGIQTTGTINGASSTSVFDNRSVFIYQNATAPMTTGKLFANQAANTFFYSLNGAQDITPPSDATPGYKNLTLDTGGAKRLLGNVSVKGTYTLTSPATLNSNGFSLTNP